jgi:hypothetical protein
VLGLLDAQARWDGHELSQRVSGLGPFGEVQVQQRQSIISQQSAWGTSYARDVIVSSNGGTVTSSAGAIYLATNSGGGFARLETSEFGRYSPGRAAEFGIGVRFDSNIGAGGRVRVGMGDDQNAVYYEFVPGDKSLQLLREGTVIASVGEDAWDYGGGLGIFEPSSRGFIMGGVFTWYGYGKIVPTIWFADPSTTPHMTEVGLHEFEVNSGTSLVDPNLPLFVEVTSGDGTIVEVGGRRYDIQGQFEPPTRLTGKSRSGLFTGANSAWNVPVAFRRKADFPYTGKNNTVTAYLSDFAAFADVDVEINFFSVGDVGGTWEAPTWVATTETCVEMNVGITSLNINSAVHRAGPFLVHASDAQGNQPANFGNARATAPGIRVPLIREDSLIMAVRATAANTAEYDVVLRIEEEW